MGEIVEGELFMGEVAVIFTFVQKVKEQVANATVYFVFCPFRLVWNLSVALSLSI